MFIFPAWPMSSTCIRFRPTSSLNDQRNLMHRNSDAYLTSGCDVLASQNCVKVVIHDSFGFPIERYFRRIGREEGNQ